MSGGKQARIETSYEQTPMKRHPGPMGIWLLSVAAAVRLVADEPNVATLDEVLVAKTDLWGDAARQQTNGASYEFFAGLLPPLRYVNAQFHHYPIVLGSPGSTVKARLVSNGSAINARGGQRSWRDIGTPVSFYVGENRLPFGEAIRALDGPRYERGYLPIVQTEYRDGEATYREESFASVDWPDHAVVFAQFTLKRGSHEIVTARLETNAPLMAVDNTIRDGKGRILLAFDRAWNWNAGQRTLTAQLSGRDTATLAVATVPVDPSTNRPFRASDYDAQRSKCAARWEAVLANAAHVEVPEPIVNAAWKATIIGSFLLLHGDRMNYSAGNQYETMYEAESGDVVRALMLWGLNQDSRRMIPPLLDFGVDPGLRFHDAAFKMQLLAHYYWLTRDARFVRDQQARWSQAVEILTRERDAATGLLPRENYCGDEHDKVFSLNSNANAWRGLRDMAVVLGQIGDEAAARNIRATADGLRRSILAAVEKSERRDAQPPFIPIALFGEEQPYDALTATRRGSYWNLMIPYVIGSGIFNGSERDGWPLRYLEAHGGVCMGMIRFSQHSKLFANEDGLDDLYGLRYVDALLRRDEPERAITSFYGKLAQGMTRDTFLSAEGTGLRPLDDFGRPMYLPPTSSGNALFLWTLRSLLVQDQDLDHDGEPETLRLLFATPRRWLEDGKQIRIERAPTAFGEVSVRVESKLVAGAVIAHVNLPARNPARQTLLRLRLPQGWRTISAKIGSRELPLDASGTVDLSTARNKNLVRFEVRRE
ncbi:MAG TPA: hypothetical protein PKN95_12500 [Verrucomicrobiota bacterium]|nr:hypothetical protein [Verrucomicrobiota bacterium]